jgi:anti-sigma factor RsiW
MKSLTHSQCRRYLDLAADGELDGPARAALDQHLADCIECRAYAEELKRVHVALKLAGERYRRRVRRTPDLSARVLNRLAQTNVRPFWLRITGGLAQLGGLAVVAFLAFSLWRPTASLAPVTEEAAHPANLVPFASPPRSAQPIPAFELNDEAGGLAVTAAPAADDSPGVQPPRRRPQPDTLKY